MNEEPRKQALVSVIIATFNAEEHIRQCIESIISQREKNLEIVIIDGESRDNTLSIVKEFREKNIVWISEPDKGIYDALNKGCLLYTSDAADEEDSVDLGG